MMPLDLYLIRHGESEGNKALGMARSGNSSVISSPEYQLRHGSTWRLTEEGVEQARSTGGFLRGSFDGRGKRSGYYVSSHVRARETAGHLSLPSAQWRQDINLRERDWGDLERLSPDQLEFQYKSSMMERKIHPFYWRPPGGESLADVCQRVLRFFDTLHRDELSHAVVVCHGEVMWAFRFCLERMSQERFHELDRSTSQIDRIHNCQILHYTRSTPPSFIQHQDSLRFYRSVVPWHTSLYDWSDWNEIKPTKSTNEDLLTEVENYPRLIL